MSDTNVISGFPGVGKTTLSRDYPGIVSDSDSSKFNKSFFPQNYIEHVKERVAENKIVLVSTHREVRRALTEAGIEFLLIYPERDCYEEYMQRYLRRNSPAGFIELMKQQWHVFRDDCERQLGCQHVVMRGGQYLTKKFLTSL